MNNILRYTHRGAKICRNLSKTVHLVFDRISVLLDTFCKFQVSMLKTFGQYNSILSCIIYDRAHNKLESRAHTLNESRAFDQQKFAKPSTKQTPPLNSQILPLNQIRTFVMVE
jgi:hypothetical protein